MHCDATRSCKPVGLVEFFPLSRNPLFEANEAEYEFRLSVMKQLDDNGVCVRQPVGIGSTSYVSQKAFVGLKKGLAQAQGGNPETSLERAHPGIAFDIQVEQLMAQRFGVPVQRKQGFKLPRTGLVIRQKLANRSASEVLRLDRGMARQGLPNAI